MKWILYTVTSLVILGCNSIPNQQSNVPTKDSSIPQSTNPQKKSPPSWFIHPKKMSKNGYFTVAVGESRDLNTAKSIAELKLQHNLAKYVYKENNESTSKTLNVDIAGTIKTNNELRTEFLDGKNIYKWYIEGFISNEIIQRERSRLGLTVNNGQ
ncbi:hypothetical protein L1D29_06885 [Shewanella insulae]|uniref:hypothetical protein n=1 Tax=Shewanella insulae TaxID=2681496 RepID=UPI001EFECB12|nr:hypothetical protein [Shewanella insulae]MCG9712535.1 hypothetical protein [Shewanella insulae]